MSKAIQTLEQRLHLTPQQILEANILQLSLSTLERRINDEIEKNPALDIIDENENSKNENEEEDNFEWDELVSNPSDLESDNLYNNKEISYTPNNLDEKDLTQDIISQLEDMNIKNNEIKIAFEILGNLNDQGFLAIEPVLIADRLQINEEKILQVIDKIKTLDPPGIASSNMQECILAQLKYFYPKEITSQLVIENYFDSFIKRKYDYIINKMCVSSNDLLKAIDIISSLNPNPAINYCNSSIEHIIPDIILEKQENNWHISINNYYVPNLKINKNYINMLKEHTDNKEVKKFIKSKIDSANWFISAIEQRNITYKKVMESIMNHQKQYFNSDDKVLNPLILKDIAKDIDMDVSTISRVTNGKYVQMPWGIKELKVFFSEGIKTKDGNLVSNHEVKKNIQSIINKEDKSNPISDEKITKKINKIGFLVARRTVSKYRELLNIPVARLRKKIKDK